MTLNELKAEIRNLRCNLLELKAQAHAIWIDADCGTAEEEISSDIEYALSDIICDVRGIEDRYCK